jgi:hypothetical protein
MTLRDLTALTIKISGVVLFVLIVAKLPEYLKAFLTDSANSGSDVFWVYFLPIVLPALVSILLFTFPVSIANRIIASPNNEIDTNFDLVTIELVLIRVLGLLLLYLAVSDLVFHLSNLLVVKRDLGSDFSIQAYRYPYLIATAAEFAFAFWLLVGTNNVVNFVKKLRRE